VARSKAVRFMALPPWVEGGGGGGRGGAKRPLGGARPPRRPVRPAAARRNQVGDLGACLSCWTDRPVDGRRPGPARAAS